ncbi:MAG: S1 RNA-binding domain-containing protein [Clostridia bacterium]|nr:S1 RNA-binding domain-containing protein [Clostridia bacterium]
MENEKEMSFEELFNESLKEKETKLEKVVTGKVISITSEGEIFVDINYKADGIIPKKEYSDDENANPKDEFKVGDTITAQVLKMNDGVGNVLLSYKRIRYEAQRKELDNKVNNNEIIESKIESANDKGLITSIYGKRVFIPLSLSGIPRGENPEDYIGKNVRYRITEYDISNGKIIGSVRSVLDEEKKKIQDEFWTNCEVGKEYEGTVVAISAYGAFVDLGASQGLLHISEITWERNAKVEDFLKQGQKIKVTIKELDKENKRIKLSYSDKGPNPWSLVKEKYHVGDVVKVRVAKLMPFGAFVELEKGIEGLVHISQISEKKITKPEEELKIDQHVNAKIIDMNLEEQRIELSIRELEGTSEEYKEEI